MLMVLKTTNSYGEHFGFIDVEDLDQYDCKNIIDMCRSEIEGRQFSVVCFVAKEVAWYAEREKHVTAFGDLFALSLSIYADLIQWNNLKEKTVDYLMRYWRNRVDFELKQNVEFSKKRELDLHGRLAAISEILNSYCYKLD